MDVRGSLAREAILPRARELVNDTRRRRAFSFTITNTNRHPTWALRTLPTYYAIASALRAGYNALVIQVLHVPDTFRPICRRVRYTDACPTFGEQNRNRVDPRRRETSAITLVETSVIALAQSDTWSTPQSFCQSKRTHARARNHIGRSSTPSSVIDRRRAPTGTNRPFRSRFGAVLDARVILNAGGLHFPILLSSPTNSPHRTPELHFSVESRGVP